MAYEKQIWSFLNSKLKNPFGTAALMGNLFAESSLNPKCANGVLKKYGLTYDQYTSLSDQGEHDFVNDGVAYGLAQWCYKTRKQGLLDLAKKEDQSVGNINVQLKYLWQELQSYKTVLNALQNASSVREASDVVLLKYEKPKNQSETVKVRRAGYGNKYLEQFTGSVEVKRSVVNSWLKTLKGIL